MSNIFKAIGKGTVLFLGIKIVQQILWKNKKGMQCRDPKLTADRSVVKYIPTQLVVWKKPGVSDADFNRWKAENLQNYSGLLVKKLCANCDDSLELWEGDSVSTFISEKVAGGGVSTPSAPPSGGGDAIACFSYNLIIDLPEPLGCIPERFIDDKQSSRPQIDGPALTIAVFDTGLMPNIKAAYTVATPSCLPGGNLGWNFAYKNNVTDDDYPSHHGSAVTKFITDQEAVYRKQKINILPVKIHNSYGKSDLFSILCGFAYAANCGAKIINASFGFYASKESQAPAILSQFVKKHLTDNNILLVAAAGNVNADETVGGSITNDIRNLEHHPFFPACLSKTLENVLAVTTISMQQMEVSPSQNFSNRVVDIGVDCDVVMDDDFRFSSPLQVSNFIVGSSYATPVVTGKIAQHYAALMSAMPAGIINKSVLLQEMRNLNIIDSHPALIPFINDGNCTKKLG
jgi:hypothetical protein